MSIVTLVSGGMDSTLVGVMACEEGIETYPLFLDYGQLAAQREWDTCQKVHSLLGLPEPVKLDLSGFGKLIETGLTSSIKEIKDDAFTPGRNLIFLLMGSAYAFQKGASAVAIGLLSERLSLFPDQRQDFLSEAEKTISIALGKNIRVVAPLIEFTKADVVNLAASKGITGTYSCHTGDVNPCGRCISCLEFQFIQN